MYYDLIVVGGGPAGIWGAISAAKRGAKVAILEKKNRMGKKILVAGAGKCNLTHRGEPKDFLKRYGSNSKFLKSSLYNYKPINLINFFKEHKLPLVLIEESGKYFPHTFSSVDVVNLLYSICKRLKVDIYENTKVEKVYSKEEDMFKILTSKETYYSKNILISTGGKSYPATGSEGDGYNIAKNLGHTIIEPKPALTPVYVVDYPFSDLSGISFKGATLDLYRDSKKIGSSQGDLLITHKNFSGPLILDFSRYIFRGDTIKINYLGINKNTLDEEIRDSTSINGKMSIKKFLSNYQLPDRFSKKILKLLSISEEKKLSEITKKERLSIVNYFCDMTFVISKLSGFDNAMVTAGGVSLKDINPKTMESKLIQGFYLAGEVTDIDGDTGGFNIQAAASMGWLAGESIKF